MIDAPQGILETPLGAIRFVMTEAAHVFLHTESRHDEVVTVRGIPYHVSYHCSLIDGQWGAKDWHDPYVSRRDSLNKEPSQAARKTLRDTLAKAWAEHLALHPIMSRQAEQAKAADEVRRLANDLAELETKVAEKRAELAAAQERQAAV